VNNWFRDGEIKPSFHGGASTAFSACPPGNAKAEMKMLVSRTAFTWRDNVPGPFR
jgi:hypothetical protein